MNNSHRLNPLPDVTVALSRPASRVSHFRASGGLYISSSLFALTVSFAAPSFAQGVICAGPVCVISTATLGSAGTAGGVGNTGAVIGAPFIGGTGATGGAGVNGGAGGFGAAAQGSSLGAAGSSGSAGSLGPTGLVGVNAASVAYTVLICTEK